MPWVAVAGAVASGVVSNVMAPDAPSGGGGGGGGGGSAPAAADPFASQRPQYQDALSKLMSGTFTSSDPSYKFRFDQGQQALERSSASKGFFGSGNMGTALVDYGQQQGATEYANAFSRLSQLAGANVGSPAAAGQIIAGQQATQQQGQLAFGNLVGKAVTNTNWGDMFNGGGGSGGGNYGFTGGGTPDMNATPMADGGSAFLG